MKIMVIASVLFLLMIVCAPVTFAGYSLKELVATLPQQMDRPPSSQSVSSKCICVPYHMCDDVGIGKGDIHKQDSGKNECINDFVVCCYSPKKSSDVPGISAGGAGCGQRNPGGVDYRITAEDGEAAYGEFPWMVAILLSNSYKCGGSLIHPQVVLTAAHCVKEKGSLTVRVGEWDTQREDELYPYQEVSVSSLVIHPQFYAGAALYDAALLFLETPVTLGGNIDIACLPELDKNFDHSKCFVTGWGKSEFGKKGIHSVVLKKVEVPIVPRSQCQNSLRRTKLGDDFQLHKSFICAGGESGKDACEGDGGSPLVCPTSDRNRYAQVGIVSWGVGCGKPGIPGVYVNLPLLRNWIDDEFAKRNLEQSYD